MFFLLFNSVLSADCKFKGSNSFANTLKSLGSPSASLFSGKFGFSEAPASLGDAQEEGKLVDYIIGNVGLGAVMLIFFVLLLIYSILGLILFCCCCKPKKSEKCKLFSIPTLCHLITTALLVISIIFFFLSASTISNGVGDVTEIPNSTISGILDLTDKIGAAATNTLDAINESVEKSNKLVTNYINLLKRGKDKEKTNSDDAKTAMTSYNGAFSAWSHYRAPSADGTTTPEHKDSQADIEDLFHNTYKCSSAKATRVAVMVLGYQEITSNIFSSINTMTKNVDQMGDTITSAEENQETSMKTTKENLDNTRKDTIDPMLKDLHQISTDIYDTLNPIKSSLDTVKTYTRTVVIAATCFYAVLIFLLAAAYLFNACWSRCIVRCDWCFFILIDFLIILPGSLFAVIYFVFYDTCPNLETTFGSFLGDSLPFQKNQIKDILLCPEEQPIYDMANMSGFFDKDEFIDDIKDSVSDGSCNVDIQTGGLNESFSDFGHGLKADQITKETMWVDYANVLIPGSDDNDDYCKDQLNNFLNAILLPANDNNLKTVKTKMDSVITFGNQVEPQTNAVNEEVNTIQQRVPEIARDKLDEGLDTITCMITRCMYSPIKNPICNTVVNGFAEWIISSILAIIGIVIWSVLFMLRRKNMAKPKVTGDDGF